MADNGNITMRVTGLTFLPTGTMITAKGLVGAGEPAKQPGRWIVVGNGEVGSALATVLSKAYAVEVKDVDPKEIVPGFEVMSCCLNYAYLGRTNDERTDNFNRIVHGYFEQYQPRFVDVCSTVPPGTTRGLGLPAVHSTTRGLHPHLATSIETFVKFVAGPVAEEVAAAYEKAGIRTRTFNRPETTELAHPLSNAFYGAQLAFADEMYELCRHFGVDYTEAVIAYSLEHNAGYEQLDHKSKFRPVLYPPGGRIGGHCTVQGAELLIDAIPEALKAKVPQLARVAGYEKQGGKT